MLIPIVLFILMALVVGYTISEVMPHILSLSKQQKWQLTKFIGTCILSSMVALGIIVLLTELF